MRKFGKCHAVGIKRRSIMRLSVSVIVLLSFVILFPSILFAKSKKTWNNPANETRYMEAQRRSMEAYRQESKAWSNYDRELGRAQEDVRRVRNGAIQGTITGGPAGMAIGGAKGAAQGIFGRGYNYFQNQGRR